jgi:hypothetical protein
MYESRNNTDKKIADSIIFLCSSYFFCLTARSPAISNMATAELITALAFANTCTSKPRSASSLNLLKKATAANTTKETV